MNLLFPIQLILAEVLLCRDATEARSTVKLAEITGLDEEESLLVEIIADFEYYGINLGLDLGIRFSP